MTKGGDTEGATAYGVLDVESAAARLEAHLTAEPALGRLWRAEAALTEAVRSAALEDAPLREGDLLAKAAEARVTGPGGAGIAAARAILARLHAPGDLRHRPVGTFERLERAAGPGSVALPEGLAERLSRELAKGPGVVMPALRVAARVAVEVTPRRPVLERLAFVAADHALRRGTRFVAGGRPPGSGDDPTGIAPPGRGAWVLLPATALAAAGHRDWAPGSRAGVAELLDGIGSTLAREIGRLAALRHWTGTLAPDFASGPRRGGHRALVAHLTRRPLVTAPGLATALDVTKQTGRNLLSEAEAAGVVVQTTRRTRYRIWATPGLAERLAERTPGHSDMARPVRAAPPSLAGLQAGRGGAKAESDPAMAGVVEELDAALADLDAVLAKRSRE